MKSVFPEFVGVLVSRLDLPEQGLSVLDSFEHEPGIGLRHPVLDITYHGLSSSESFVGCR